LLAYAKELDMINVDPTIKWLNWRHALDQVILDKAIRVKEISNWLDHQVRPMREKRGRG
jgi:hypothetical protein